MKRDTQGMTFDDLVKLVAKDQAAPLSRAMSKFLTFMNEAVTDPDFCHPDSAALLDFLISSRDLLLDGITPQTSVDDIVKPIISHQASMARSARPAAGAERFKDQAISEFLESGIQRKQFAELFSIKLQAQGIQKSADQICKNWLSKAEIARYRERNDK